MRRREGGGAGWQVKAAGPGRTMTPRSEGCGVSSIHVCRRARMIEGWEMTHGLR